jgi:hypothetical protein
MTHLLARLAPLIALLGCANASAPPAHHSTATAQPTPRADPSAEAARARPSAPGLVPAPRLAPGAARATIEGCLATATEAAAASFPPPPPTRSSPPPVTVAKVPGGIAVTHRLTHACCLKGNVSTEVSGEAVVIVETLRGTPCRCLCASSLRTIVGLSPGTWEVSVDLDDRGRRRRVLSKKLTLP